MNSRQRSKEWIDQIWDSYQKRELDIATRLVEKARKETRDPRILEVGGLVAYGQSRFHDAIDFIGNAMLEVPLSFASQMVLAKSYLKTGKTDDAADILTFLVEMRHELPSNMLPDLTHALATIERFDLALATCRAAFDRHPEDDNAVFGVAFYMNRCGYPTTLVKGVVAKAIDLNPDSSVYRVNMAAVCCSLLQWDEAYQHICRVPIESLSSVPCHCITKQLRKLFEKFDDQARLERIEKK